eukprot:7818538-Lingulodinium_polyedra.AAC.1
MHATFEGGPGPGLFDDVFAVHVGDCGTNEARLPARPGDLHHLLNEHLHRAVAVALAAFREIHDLLHND